MIPKSFTLVNRKWRVLLLSAQQFERVWKETGNKDSADSMLGFTLPQAGVIAIDLDKHMTADALEHTYMHEFAHALECADGNFMEHDEKKIDRMGAFLHQYHKTKRGEYEIGGEVEDKPAGAARASRRAKDAAVPRHRGAANNRGGAKPRAPGNNRSRGNAASRQRHGTRGKGC